jgi:exonuclease VII small subunit
MAEPTLRDVLKAIQRLEKGQASLEKGQASLEKGQASLEKGQANLEKGQASLEKGQANLEKGQANLEKGQASLEKGQANLEKGQANLEKGQVEIRTEMATKANMNERFDRVDARLAELDRDLDAHMKVHAELEKDVESLKGRPVRTAARARRGSRR